MRRARAIVMGDPDELKAAVWNLIDNAIKYSPDEVAGARACSRRPTNERLAVRVQRPRRRHLAGRAEAHLPPLLPHSRRRRHARARAAASGCSSCARSPRSTAGAPLPRARGQGHGSTFTLQLPRATRGMTATAAARPHRRRRAAPGRRPALQPRGGGLRGRRSSTPAKPRWSGCSDRHARRSTSWCST